MDWVKYKTRLEEEASFPDGTTRQEVIHELEEATTRKKCRKKRIKEIWVIFDHNYLPSTA